MAQSTEPRGPRGFQFSIVKLLALIAWVAIVCVALRTPTPVWAAAIFLLALLAALASGLAILYRTGRARVFAVGFFAGCVGYATCLYVTEKHFGGQFGNENQLPTTQFASWLFQRLHPNSFGVPPGGYGPGGFGGGMGGGFGGGGMGGGGMGGGGIFSVDSSLAAEQDAAGSDSQTDGGFDPGGGYGDGGMEAGYGDPMGGMGQPAGPGMAAPAPVAPAPTFYLLNHFVVIVHSALAVLLGLAGGVIAQIWHARRETPGPDGGGP